MMNSPKISVIVPLYNAKKFVRICIDSILQQTFKDFELIVVDDQSTDGSLNEIPNDPRIKKFQNEENLGNALTRNIGLQIARGDYIFFMDDDDAILPETLEIFYNAAEESRADVVHMNSCFSAYEDGRIEKTSDKNSKVRFLSTDLKTRIETELLKVSMQPMPWKNLLRRDFLLEREILFPKVSCCEDMFLFNSLILLANRFLVIDSACCIHQIHSKALSSLSSTPKLRWIISSLPNAVSFIDELLNRKLSGIFTSEARITIEVNLLNQFFMSYAVDAYSGGIDFDEIENIELEELRKFSREDFYFVPALIHTLMGNLLNLHELQAREYMNTRRDDV